MTIADNHQAQRHGFTGSPTFMVNGADIFPAIGSPGMSCRLYQTPEGPAGLPSLRDLRQALKRALDQARRMETVR